MTKNTYPPTLETERLILRPFKKSDAGDVFEYGSDEETMRHITAPVDKTVAEAAAFIKRTLKKYRRRTSYEYAFVLKENGKVIGGGGAHNLNFPHRCELGYCLNKKYWGRGLVPEAMGAVVKHLFANNTVHRIEAYHFVGNEKSGRVMQKIGMTHEGTTADKFFCKGEYRSAEQYAIINKR